MTPAQYRALQLRPDIEALGVDRETANAILCLMREDLVAAASWRSYWTPQAIEQRIAMEREAQAELDAAEWEPVARHVQALAGRVARGELTPPPMG